jgi:hypothetical protein
MVAVLSVLSYERGDPTFQVEVRQQLSLLSRSIFLHADSMPAIEIRVIISEAKRKGNTI